MEGTKKETKMAIAYLNLYEFPQLQKILPETANDNLDLIESTINTRTIDDGKFCPPKDPFTENSGVVSFCNHKYFDDSLIIKSNDLALFIKQLSNLVATLYIITSRPFVPEFNDILNVDSLLYASVINVYKFSIRRHKAFPILFRGRVSFDSDIQVCKLGQLEQFKEKGPRLFCEKSVVDDLKDRSLIRVVDKEKEIYEIVWTVEICEASVKTIDDASSNIYDSISEKALPAAINFVKFYLSHEDEFPNILPHYTELLNLVCRGIVRYADIKCGRTEAENAVNSINKRLQINDLNEIIGNYTVEGLLEGFDEEI